MSDTNREILQRMQAAANQQRTDRATRTAHLETEFFGLVPKAYGLLKKRGFPTNGPVYAQIVHDQDDREAVIWYFSHPDDEGYKMHPFYLNAHGDVVIYDRYFDRGLQKGWSEYEIFTRYSMSPKAQTARGFYAKAIKNLKYFINLLS